MLPFYETAIKRKVATHNSLYESDSQLNIYVLEWICNRERERERERECGEEI